MGKLGIHCLHCKEFIEMQEKDFKKGKVILCPSCNQEFTLDQKTLNVLGINAMNWIDQLMKKRKK